MRKTPGPFFQERSIIFPVMPIEPTRPMPSRSSGMKDMEMPFSRMALGLRPTMLSPLWIIMPLSIGRRPAMASHSSFWPQPAIPATPRISPLRTLKVAWRKLLGLMEVKSSTWKTTSPGWLSARGTGWSAPGPPSW